MQRYKVISNDNSYPLHSNYVTLKSGHSLNLISCKTAIYSKSSVPSSIRCFAKKETFQKSELTMEVGGWVQVSLGFFSFGKSSQNRS